MRKRALISLLLFAAIVATGSAIKYRPRTVPPSECSDVYRRYADVPGVDATFVKAYPVNDTLSVDVTLLQATDTAAWRQMISDFNLINHLKTIEYQLTDSGVACLVIVSSQQYYTDTTSNRAFIGVASPFRKYICIFHYTDTHTWDGLFNAILKRVLFSLNTKEDIINNNNINNKQKKTNYEKNN